MLCEFRVRGVAVRLALLPVEGFVVPTPDPDGESHRGTRWRELGISAAGPLANAGVMLVGFLLPPDLIQLDLGVQGADSAVPVGPLLFWAGALYVAISLIPMKGRIGDTPAYTDGATIAMLLVSSRSALDERVEERRSAAAAVDAVRSEDPHRIIDAVPHTPGNPATALVRATAFAQLARHQEAIDEVTPVKLLPMENRLRCLLLNVLAWSTVHVNGQEHLDAANYWSLQALELAEPADLPAVSSTRGRVLLERGQPEEAIGFLDRALAGLDHDRPELAEVHAARALARWATGELGGSRHDAAEAVRLDPGRQIVQRALDTVHSPTPH